MKYVNCLKDFLFGAIASVGKGYNECSLCLIFDILFDENKILTYFLMDNKIKLLAKS